MDGYISWDNIPHDGSTVAYRFRTTESGKWWVAGPCGSMKPGQIVNVFKKDKTFVQVVIGDNIWPKYYGLKKNGAKPSYDMASFSYLNEKE